MVGSNLPPGVTASDIDNHFGAPDKSPKAVEAIVDLYATEAVDPTEALSVSGGDAEVVHHEQVAEEDGEIIYAVYVGMRFESQYRDDRDIAKQARKMLSVSSDDERVSLTEHIETEVH